MRFLAGGIRMMCRTHLKILPPFSVVHYILGVPGPAF